MPTTCTITFDDNPEKVCYSGTLLKGSVLLNTVSEKRVRSLFIKIQGEANCEWSEGLRRHRRTFIGKEIYLDERTYFVSNTNADEVILPGSYTYTFQCQLPPDLPTSLEGTVGYIRYTASVCFHLPMLPDEEFEEVFTVIKQVDLNKLPHLQEPQTITEKAWVSRYCCWCCCINDPMDITATMPVGGYAPGQTINLEIDTINRTPQDVHYFHAQLYKQINYYIPEDILHKREETILITEKKSDAGCPAGQDKTCKINLEVPPTPPTDESSSKICKVRYDLEVHVDSACCQCDPPLIFPIVIGSIPILDTGANAPSYTAVITQQPIATPQEEASSPLLPQPSAPSFHDLDLPTYAEAMSTHDKDDTKDQQNKAKPKFNPKYPMFRRNTSYSSNN